jgi:hypothetical protein
MLLSSSPSSQLLLSFFSLFEMAEVRCVGAAQTVPEHEETPKVAGVVRMVEVVRSTAIHHKR